MVPPGEQFAQAAVDTVLTRTRSVDKSPLRSHGWVERLATDGRWYQGAYTLS
jgi:hypothetical protein